MSLAWSIDFEKAEGMALGATVRESGVDESANCANMQGKV